MVSLPKPEVILTHESDLDGFVAGLLLQRLGRGLFNLMPPLQAYHYDHWRQRPLKEHSAWVTDFSFEQRLDKPNWVVIDHHPASQAAKNAILFHDLNKSSSLLCYELCQQHGLGSPVLDRLVHLSNVADLFLLDDPDFELANDYANLVKTYQFWNLHALVGEDLERLLNHPLLEVMAVKRRVEDPLGLEWSKANVVEVSPEAGYVPTVIGNANLIVHKLLEEHTVPYSVLITLTRKSNGVISASLRSRNGEALKAAISLQGGGHANASGATLPRSVQRMPDAIDYLCKVLNPALGVEPAQSNLESLFDSLDGTAPVQGTDKQS